MQRFIIGTGRCGSTLLSRMMDCHPQAVCLHEFFTGLDWGQRFQPGMVSADTLQDFLCAEQAVTTMVLSRGYRTEEICYPFGEVQAKHGMADPLPWLLISMLSRLTADPEPLFERFTQMLQQQADAPLQDHYPAIFSWLAQQGSQCSTQNKADSAVWIERSGSSVDYLPALVDMFPEGRFLHIHRDGCEAALSIRSHPFYRLGVTLMYGLFPDNLDDDQVIDYALENPPPLQDVGRYWSDQVLNGYRALAKLDRSQYLEVRFEDLLNTPRDTLQQVATFFELDSPESFLQHASSLCKSAPALRHLELNEHQQQELMASCRPGQCLLGRA
jgi:hypothetical protein